MPDAPPAVPSVKSTPAAGATPLKVSPPATIVPAASVNINSANSAFDELDKMGGSPAKSKPAPKKEGKEFPPTKPSSSAEPAESPSAGEKLSTEEAAGSKTQDSTTTDAPQPGVAANIEKVPVKVPELRAAYENVKKENKTLKAEIEKFKSGKPADDPDKPKLVEALTSAQKRLSVLEEELKYSAYEKSDDYQTQYEKPFIAAYQSGRVRATQLTVTQEDGTTRAGTAQDFDAIMSIPSDAKAASLAHELFGPQAMYIINDRADIQKLNRARSQAIEEFQKHGSERDKQRAAQEVSRRHEIQQRMSQMGERFKALNEDAIKKYPQWFTAEEGDEEGARLLSKGFEFSDRAFSGANGMQAEDLVALHSAMRNKAGAFDYVVHKAKLQSDEFKARISELEEELKEFKSSEPGADNGKRTEASRQLSPFDEIDAIAAGESLR